MIPADDSDKAYERIQTKCLQLHDQKWESLRNNDDVPRIALLGPEPGDAEFVKRVFTLLFYKLRHNDDGTVYAGEATNDTD